MSQQPPQMPCPKCQGSGCVELPPHMQSILKYLQEHGARTASQIHRDVPGMAGRTNVNNALNNLEGVGLVSRSCDRRDGYLWRAKERA